jgi:hypothetical protein
MYVPGIVTHISRQINRVSSLCTYITLLHHIVLNITSGKVNNNSQTKSLLHRESQLVDLNLEILWKVLIVVVICYPSRILIQKNEINKCEYIRTPQV